MKNKIAIGILSASMVLSAENALACYKEKREVILQTAQNKNHDTGIKESLLADSSHVKSQIHNSAKNSHYLESNKINKYLHINKDCLQLGQNPPIEPKIKLHIKQPLFKVKKSHFD